ncbi:hypothetical protein A9239_06280 [Methanosarcina sp. A14]|uniref:Calcineurin-like phosphoesterase domain-containing protein n=1 Tax=Methanosarcina barkeri MS TaxID=1434108 RepID=A0A0E3QSS1_METBA|nr:MULTISPECIES: hypothetical protein [Methanosarcina]AKB53600.1 hypothetical protein MSBRM_0602 [Methanosarcina barkeri MS]OED12699.1 hypothetical protein A9239_06280 [Methanosarcina sp. A14]
MSAGEANYTFPLGTNCKTIRHNDNVKIIKHNSDLQPGKMTAELFDSTDQKECVVTRNKETNQFLYMDVGRWGGDKDTGDAWTRRRNFGLVCGSVAILCNYENPNSSINRYLGKISEEVLNSPEAKVLIPLLDKLSESTSLGPVTVVNALVCADGITEAPCSDEILVFLGDIHAPIMNCCNRTYLQDTNPIDITWAWPRGRLDINDEIITKNGENEKNVVSFLTEVKELRSVTDIKKIKDIVKKIFGESLEGRKIMQLMDKSIENSFEPQQLNSLDNSQNIKLNNVHIIVMLKMILEVLLDPQNLNEWDENKEITGNNAYYWFNLYHGDGNKKGADIFQNAGRDLYEFINLLKDYQKQGSILATLVQLGDLYDFWLGLKRAFNTIDPQKMYSDPAAQSFLEFWRNETLTETSEYTSKAINLLVNETEDLNTRFIYGNHDSYRMTPLWKHEKVSDHFESTGVWAEHGHQSDVFNEDPNAIIGWAAALFGFHHPESRNLEEPLRDLECLIFGLPSRRHICTQYAARLCLQKNKRIYVMGHTHEPLLEKIPLK